MNPEERDHYRQFRFIGAGAGALPRDEQQRHAHERREPAIDEEDEDVDEHDDDTVVNDRDDLDQNDQDQQRHQQPRQQRHVQPPLLAGLPAMLDEMDVEAPGLPAPAAGPDLEADRAYLDGLNQAFGRLNVENLVRPPVPVPRRQVHRLPTTGVDTTKHLVRHQIQVSDLLAQQQQTINNLLFWIGNPDLQNEHLGEVRQSATQAAQAALDLKAQAVHFQANMQRAAHVTDRYSSTPTMPTWDHLRRDAPMGRPCDIIAACGKFDPKTTDADFGIVWDNLRFLGTNNLYRENNYRIALSYVLDGEAKRIFHDLMDANPVPPLVTIVDTLYRAYAKPKSTIDDKQALKDVVRQANEPLPRCIARGTIAIDRQRHMHEPSDWPVLRKNMIRDLVYQVVDKQTQKFIAWLENDSIATTGVVCDVDRLIELVDQEERRHGWIPKQAKEVVFTAAATGIFKETPRPDKQQHHKGGKQQPQHRQPQQPQHQPKGQKPQSQHHTKPKGNNKPQGMGKTVTTYSVNATDFDGDDTMTGKDFDRSRREHKNKKKKSRSHSAGSDQYQPRTEYRENANKPQRHRSHSPNPGRGKQKSKPNWNGKDSWNGKDQKSDNKQKKKKKTSSQSQSGTKNVIVRVDTAQIKGDFRLDPSNLIPAGSAQPDFVISGPGSEN